MKKIEYKWLNKNERDILEPYLEFLKLNNNNTKQKLTLSNGVILYVTFLGYSESDNDLDMNEENFEEFYEFYFKIERVKNKCKEFKNKKNDEIFFNYHNFPVKFEIRE